MVTPSPSAPSALTQLPIDPALLLPLKQVTNEAAAPLADGDKVQMGGFLEFYGQVRDTPSAYAVKNTPIASVHPSVWRGANEPLPYYQHVTARVFPFTINPIDAYQKTLKDQLDLIPNQGGYLKDKDGNVVMRNGCYGIDLTNERAFELALQHVVGDSKKAIQGASSSYAQLHLAGFDNYESMLSSSNQPDVNYRRAVITKGRELITQISTAMQNQGKPKPVIGDLSANDGTYEEEISPGVFQLKMLTGQNTIEFVLKNGLTDNLILRDQFSTDPTKPVSDFMANRIATYRGKYPDVNFLLVSYGAPAITAENAGYIKNQLVQRLGSGLAQGTGKVNFQMTTDYDLINSADLTANMLVKDRIKPFAVVPGVRGLYFGAQNATTLTSLKQFQMAAVQDSTQRDFTTHCTTCVTQVNPYLIDPSTQQGADALRRIESKVLTDAAGQPLIYVRDGKQYQLPDMRVESVRTALKQDASQVFGYGGFLTGLSDYEKAVDQLVRTGATTISPNAEILPGRTILPDGGDNRKAILTASRQFTTELLASQNALELFTYMDDLSYSSPDMEPTLLQKFAGDHMVVRLTHGMTDAQIRTKLAQYKDVGAQTNLIVTYGNMPVIDAASVTAAQVRIATLAQEVSPGFKRFHLSMATDEAFLNAADLPKNLQFKPANAREGMAEETETAQPGAPTFPGTQPPLPGKSGNHR